MDESIGSISSDEKIQANEAGRLNGLITGLAALVRRQRWFVIVVILPTLIAAIYYTLIASDIYLSESRFVVRSPGEKQSQMSGLASLLQTTGVSGGQQDTDEVLDYIRSRNAVSDLQREIGLRGRLASPFADRLARYPAPWQQDRLETLFSYYGSMISARVDTDTGVAVLEVKAFTPADAYKINASLLDLSEQLVNRLNGRAQKAAIAEGERRVAEGEARVRKARLALARYRNTEQLLDPAKQATGVIEISNQLVATQAALQAQLDLTTKVAPENPAIPSLRSRIAAIGRQIDVQNDRATGGNSGIASKLGAYENLALEQEFGAQMLTAANVSLEQARSDAQKQQFYLERVVEPNFPDLARYPQRLKQVLTIAAATLCLYFIGWMLVVGVLEHSPED